MISGMKLHALIILGFYIYVCGQCIAQERVVVIDAGHGGEFKRGKSDGSQQGDGSSSNNAKSSVLGVLEKDLTLEYSLEIGKAFAASERAKALNIRCVQTRTTDKHLSAISRSAVAVETVQTFLYRFILMLFAMEQLMAPKRLLVQKAIPIGSI